LLLLATRFAIFFRDKFESQSLVLATSLIERTDGDEAFTNLLEKIYEQLNQDRRDISLYRRKHGTVTKDHQRSEDCSIEAFKRVTGE
jgi:hypothetical protein